MSGPAYPDIPRLHVAWQLQFNGTQPDRQQTTATKKKTLTDKLEYLANMMNSMQDMAARVPKSKALCLCTTQMKFCLCVDPLLSSLSLPSVSKAKSLFAIRRVKAIVNKMSFAT